MRRAINMRLESDPILVNLAVVAEAEHLKAATIREQRAVPGHEAMQPTKLLYRISAGPQIKMVSIPQDYRRVESLQLVRRQRFDAGLRAHRHKHRRLNLTMRSTQYPCACRAEFCILRSYEVKAELSAVYVLSNLSYLRSGVSSHS